MLSPPPPFFGGKKQNSLVISPFYFLFFPILLFRYECTHLSQRDSGRILQHCKELGSITLRVVRRALIPFCTCCVSFGRHSALAIAADVSPLAPSWASVITSWALSGEATKLSEEPPIACNGKITLLLCPSVNESLSQQQYICSCE